MLKAIARVDLLILDDWGLAVLTPSERRDLLEILEDRHGRGSTIVTSNSRSSLGTRPSPIPPWRTPSWIVSFTTPTDCSSPAKACEEEPRNPLTSTRRPEPMKPVGHTARPVE